MKAILLRCFTSSFSCHGNTARKLSVCESAVSVNDSNTVPLSDTSVTPRSQTLVDIFLSRLHTSNIQFRFCFKPRVSETALLQSDRANTLIIQREKCVGFSWTFQGLQAYDPANTF